MRPQPGLCLPCELEKVRDGDTVVVRVLAGAYQWAIRLIDCWAPEGYTNKGKAASAYAATILATTPNLHVYIPAPNYTENLLKNLTFDRIPGYIYLSETKTLNELMVESGHATARKESPPWSKP